MRKLKNTKTGNIFRYTEALAKRIGIDMIEITEQEAVAVVKEEAKAAEALIAPVDDSLAPAEVLEPKKEKKAKKAK